MIQSDNTGAILLSVALVGLPNASLAEDFAPYPEYWAAPNCEQPKLEPNSNSSLDVCESMYKKGSFVEWQCESEALFKQRTAPQLLQDYDVKYLANVANRKEACMDLLAKKGELGLWDTISRWWTG